MASLLAALFSMMNPIGGVGVEFQIKDGKAGLVRMPKLDFANDKAGKPVGIQEHIGRRPILAFGNSDSDIQMIECTADITIFDPNTVGKNALPTTGIG